MALISVRVSKTTIWNSNAQKMVPYCYSVNDANGYLSWIGSEWLVITTIDTIGLLVQVRVAYGDMGSCARADGYKGAYT